MQGGTETRSLRYRCRRQCRRRGVLAGVSGRAGRCESCRRVVTSAPRRTASARRAAPSVLGALAGDRRQRRVFHRPADPCGDAAESALSHHTCRREKRGHSTEFSAAISAGSAGVRRASCRRRRKRPTSPRHGEVARARRREAKKRSTSRQARLPRWGRQRPNRHPSRRPHRCRRDRACTPRAAAAGPDAVALTGIRTVSADSCCRG